MTKLSYTQQMKEQDALQEDFKADLALMNKLQLELISEALKLGFNSNNDYIIEDYIDEVEKESVIEFFVTGEEDLSISFRDCYSLKEFIEDDLKDDLYEEDEDDEVQRFLEDEENLKYPPIYFVPGHKLKASNLYYLPGNTLLTKTLELLKEQLDLFQGKLLVFEELPDILNEKFDRQGCIFHGIEESRNFFLDNGEEFFYIYNVLKEQYYIDSDFNPFSNYLYLHVLSTFFLFKYILYQCDLYQKYQVTDDKVILTQNIIKKLKNQAHAVVYNAKEISNII